MSVKDFIIVIVFVVSSLYLTYSNLKLYKNRKDEVTRYKLKYNTLLIVILLAIAIDKIYVCITS